MIRGLRTFASLRPNPHFPPLHPHCVDAPAVRFATSSSVNLAQQLELLRRPAILPPFAETIPPWKPKIQSYSGHFDISTRSSAIRKAYCVRSFVAMQFGSVSALTGRGVDEWCLYG